MSENINTRLSKFIEHLKISQNEFAKSIGVSSPLISQMINKNSNFGIDTLYKIVTVYPNLNIDWLLKGVNPMILDQAPLPGNRSSVKIPVINDQKYFDYVHDLVDLNSKNILSMILPSHEFFYPQTASFQVNQNNMAPTLYPNDYVITEMNYDWKNNLLEGGTYVIVNRNNIFFKRFKMYRHSELIFENDNLSFPEDVFYASEIKEIWTIKSKLSFHLHKQKNSIQTIENLSGILKTLQEQKNSDLMPVSDTNRTIPANYLSNLFSNLRKQKVSIFYYGELSLKISIGLKERIKDRLNASFKRDIKNRKRIYSLCIEIFSVLSNPSLNSSFFFSLVCSSEVFFISVGSVMPTAQARTLNNELKITKSLNEREILKRVKNIITAESPKETDHVLLGLLAIANHAGNTYESLVEEVGEDESLFILKIESKLQ